MLRAQENRCRFATLQLESLRAHRWEVHFLIKSVAEVVAERRNVVQK